MLDGGTNCGKGEQQWQPYMVRRDHWWRRVWFSRTTCSADNLRRDKSRVARHHPNVKGRKRSGYARLTPTSIGMHITILRQKYDASNLAVTHSKHCNRKGMLTCYFVLPYCSFHSCLYSIPVTDTPA